MRCSCNALFLLHANTYEIIQSEFSREFLKTIFARLPPLASAARIPSLRQCCGVVVASAHERRVGSGAL